jgi:hypothetical protein
MGVVTELNGDSLPDFHLVLYQRGRLPREPTRNPTAACFGPASLPMKIRWYATAIEFAAGADRSVHPPPSRQHTLFAIMVCCVMIAIDLLMLMSS